MDKSIDELIQIAVFSSDASSKSKAREEIRNLAKEKGIVSSSIYPLYKAFGRGEVKGFTVPAINVRMMTYDTAQIVFTLLQKHNIGPVLFEIARSEIVYTDQRPDEYTVVILAAAIKAGYKGAVFLQGDHFQFSKSKFAKEPDAEINRIKDLIKESIEAGFYNIDIDASTLVDLTKEALDEQQKQNYEMTIELTHYIQELQSKGMGISIGGEIGHIGGKNSTVDDFESFMQGYKTVIKENGISKVSVQTGTSHGGVPLADGTMAQIKLDFSVLEGIGIVARKKYGLGGAVQHGASTLPNELFSKFPQSGTLEIHLATGFQNLVYDNMPEALRKEMEKWVVDNCADEREEGWTDEQFIYKMRKKAIGPFKEKLWSLSESEKAPIKKALEDQLAFLFEKLNVFNARATVDKYIHVQ